MLTPKLISLIPVPFHAVNTNLFITATPHRSIQLETGLRLEYTMVWSSKLGSYLIGYTVVRLSYLIDYSLVYQLKRVGSSLTLVTILIKCVTSNLQRLFYSIFWLIEILGENCPKNHHNLYPSIECSSTWLTILFIKLFYLVRHLIYRISI